MNIRTFFYLLAFAFPAGFLSGQVAAPNLECIQNDTLKWSNVNNNCGPYLATLVFGATDINGPYTQVASLNDLTATQFFDPNPTGELRFYFLQYSYDCPGQAVFNSDTLDNRIPLPPSATWVSVEDNNVIVHWTGSSSPEVSGYLIYRREPQGLIVVGQVAGANTLSFTDTGVAMPPNAVSYRVTAIDNCGNNSLFGPEVTTASFSIAGGTGCTAQVTLATDPSPMASNPLPIIGWELFVAIDGGPFQSAGTFSPLATTFTYDDANDGENLCFYAEATIQGQLGRPVRTPIACQTIAITQPVRPFALFGAGFDPNGNLIFDFEWDNLAAVNLLTANLVDGNGLNMMVDLPFASLTAPEANAFIDRIDIPDNIFSLALRAEDSCDNLVISNNVSPVFISGEVAQSGTNALSWTPFNNELNVNVTYQLNRIAQDGSTTQVYSGNDVSFMDPVGTDDPNLALSCYQVISLVTFPDGNTRSYNSQTVCLEQQPMIYIPNAFSPTANQILNREFCPGFSRIPTGAYQMDIYDRWGGHVFSSQDPLLCWNGQARGQAANPGVYLYVLRVEIGSRTIERKGDITLLP